MASKSLRVSLSLSGGASLGAFQAGNAAALLVAFQHLRDTEDVDVRVDAIGGASAGALVSLMTAHAILSGADPVELLTQVWVERVSIETLFDGGNRGPLTFGEVRKSAPELLASGGEGGPRQEHPLMLHVALTGLQGLTYEISGVRNEPIMASTYDDWGEFKLEPGGGIEQLTEPSGCSPLDFVLASASHPGAFAPRVIDRSADEDEYTSQGIHSFPKSGNLWYTDGGLIQSKPLGRVIAAGRRLDDGDLEDCHRLNLMIDPRSEEPSDAGEWSDPEHDADWASGLGRALAILPSQALYDDLRAVQRDNHRLDWAAEIVEAISPHMSEDGGKALRPVIDRIASERQERRGGGEPAESPPEDASLEDLLRRAIGDVAGITGKESVSVDVLSPLLLADDGGDGVPSLLAGELLGDFGGFLAQDLRRSDFALGYETATAWARVGLEPCGLNAAAAKRTIEKIEERCPYDWEDVRQGKASHRDLPWRARLNLGRLFLRAGRSMLP